MSSRSLPRPTTLAITSGDPCGIGPEVILKVLAGQAALPCRLIVIGDLVVFEHTARRLGLRLPKWAACPADHLQALSQEKVWCVHIGSRGRFQPGRPTQAAGEAAISYVDVALRLWRQGQIDGLVTAPVTKWAIEQARGRFVGHTEYLAEALESRVPVMMFTAPRLRIVLLTRHLPLRRVGPSATPPLLRHTVAVVIEGLRRWFGVRRPRLALCGLNPHAGEAGAVGNEDERVVVPVIRALRRRGIRLDGPVAADGFFAGLYGPSGEPRSASAYDAILCWYHDQGLIPFKLIARDIGCQVTLGLPLVRTSPDHGSALDIAGKGIANPGSMRYAMHVAAHLARRARRFTPHAHKG